MFSLDNLTPITKSKKRVGRGGSRGGTSGKGHKGQKARSGGSVHPRFEGGQMPLHRRLPKRGFTNARFKINVVTVNLEQLDRFDEGSEITKQLLIDQKVIKAAKSKGDFILKVLGAGDLSKKFVVVADAFSKSASQAITNAGGQARLAREG